MDVETTAPIITDLVKALRARLETIASVAKAGHACADAGSPHRAIEIVIELGDDLHEAQRLFDAALAVSLRTKG